MPYICTSSKKKVKRTQITCNIGFCLGFDLKINMQKPNKLCCFFQQEKVFKKYNEMKIKRKCPFAWIIQIEV